MATVRVADTMALHDFSLGIRLALGRPDDHGERPVGAAVDGAVVCDRALGAGRV
jgi:hypothetical protein